MGGVRVRCTGVSVGCAGVWVGCAEVIRYQDVGISNAKSWHWVSKPMRGPNINGFVFWWNIGLKNYNSKCYKKKE